MVKEVERVSKNAALDVVVAVHEGIRRRPEHQEVPDRDVALVLFRDDDDVARRVIGRVAPHAIIDDLADRDDLKASCEATFIPRQRHRRLCILERRRDVAAEIDALAVRRARRHVRRVAHAPEAVPEDRIPILSRTSMESEERAARLRTAHREVRLPLGRVVEHHELENGLALENVLFRGK